MKLRLILLLTIPLVLSLSENEILQKLEALEKEIQNLKKIIIAEHYPKGKNFDSCQDIL